MGAELIQKELENNEMGMKWDFSNGGKQNRSFGSNYIERNIQVE